MQKAFSKAWDLIKIKPWSLTCHLCIISSVLTSLACHFLSFLSNLIIEWFFFNPTLILLSLAKKKKLFFWFLYYPGVDVYWKKKMQIADLSLLLVQQKDTLAMLMGDHEKQGWTIQRGLQLTTGETFILLTPLTWPLGKSVTQVSQRDISMLNMKHNYDRILNGG